MAADARLAAHFASPPVRVAEEPAVIWVPCGTCWGAREIWTLDVFGRMSEKPEPCDACLGLGEVTERRP